MPEETKENLGEIIIAPEVLEIIIGIATSRIDGVYSLRNRRTLNSLGRKSEGRGIYIKTSEEKVSVDIYVFLTANVRVPKVAQEIQTTVKERIRDYTEIELSEVNIHIVGTVSEDEKKPDFNDLFEEGFFDVK